jgi:IMP dehydrogenase
MLSGISPPVSLPHLYPHRRERTHRRRGTLQAVEERRATDIELSLTYDDVLLVPRYSSLASRAEASPQGRFSREIALAAPIVSANMETVTEWRTAIAMARSGGLGIIHRFLPIDGQVEQVRRVKRAEAAVIHDPYSVAPDATIADARRLMRLRSVHGLVVVDADGRLVGMLTRRDLRAPRIADEDRVIDHATTDVVTAPPFVSAERARELMHERRVEKLPLVEEDGRVAGLITAADLIAVEKRPHAAKDASGRLLVGAAVGIKEDCYARAEALLDAGADCLVLDIAHGHSRGALAVLQELRRRHPDAQLVAGNVATGEGAEALCEAGADGVKVGVGPGAACSTRIVAGVGVPQLSAVMTAVAACRRHGVPVNADGGIRSSGDVAKALAAGASSVMVGSLLAGCDESPGEVVRKSGGTFKVYRGMASAEAARRRPELQHVDPVDLEELAQPTPEGVEATVPYRGPAADLVAELVGGVKSAMSYSDARTLEEFWERARFTRITPAGLAESHPHALP